MTTKTEKKRIEIENFLTSRGYVEDRHGHYKKTFKDSQLWRYKMGKTSLRREHQIKDANNKNMWVKHQAAYYKNCEITADNKIKFLKTM